MSRGAATLQIVVVEYSADGRWFEVNWTEVFTRNDTGNSSFSLIASNSVRTDARPLPFRVMAEGVTLNIGDFRTNTIFLFVIAVVVLLIRLKQFWEFPRRVLFTTSVFCWCYYFHFVFMGFVRILGFWDFFLWFVSMLLSSDTDGRTDGRDGR